MYVDRIPFLVTASRGIKFITIEHSPTQTTSHLKQSLVQVMQLYGRAGFRVQTVLVDGLFEPLKRELANIVVNTTASSEHVGDIKRYLRVIKERARAVTSSLPYRRMPKSILIELLAFVVMWLNAFPNKSGISKTLSPREIVIRQRIDYSKHCKAQFGSYCTVFDDPNPTNTMVAQTQPAVCLGPTGNLQGTYKFFALNTGRVIKRRQFKELPMPKSMVKTIESLDDSGSVGELIFANNRGKPYTWNRRISTTKTMKPQNNALFPALPAELPGIIVDQIENDQTADIAIQQETEANDVIETMDIDREVPHLAFGNRDQNLDTIEEGDANIVPIHDTTEQQLIDDITRERDITGSVDELITDMDDVQ
ncbi:hypothetical protein ACHAXS_003437 [Conticribra weissflogii]